MTRKHSSKKRPPTRIDERIKKQMASPRITKSAKIAQLKREAPEIKNRPNTTMSGTVKKLLLSTGPGHCEQAEIGMDLVDPLYKDLRIENKLTDAHGGAVKLKKGAHVDVIISRPPDTSPEE